MNMSANKKERNQKSKDLKEVQGHYEDYPYPYRDPEEEKKRLLQTIGDYLGEINHWLYKGQQSFGEGFRVLIAGGGTGDAAVYLGEQLKNTKAEIVYLDFSKPSMELAQKRAKNRGLTNIKWVLDSILNLPNIGLGKFDYINVSGVLHHLESPPEGLQCLADSLRPGGGMHIMIYAQYGRTGVYQVQDIMKMVNNGATHRVQEVANGKIIIDSLPTSNWYMRGQDLLADHKKFGDIGLYDMFLHKQDRAYTIPQVYEYASNAGLNVVQWTDIKSRVLLKPANYIKDFTLLQRIQQMDKITQEAIGELMCGSIIKHSFYVSNAKDTVASFDDLDNVPYFYAAQGVYTQMVKSLEDNPKLIGSAPSVTISTALVKDVNLNIPISHYSLPILKSMGDKKSFGEMFDIIRTELVADIPNELLIEESKNLLKPFEEIGAVLLWNKCTIWS